MYLYFLSGCNGERAPIPSNGDMTYIPSNGDRTHNPFNGDMTRISSNDINMQQRESVRVSYQTCRIRLYNRQMSSLAIGHAFIMCVCMRCLSLNFSGLSNCLIVINCYLSYLL
ncbi:uncharacterized protein DS421_7g221040 [Arachis hypogaea]|nr:uncharacterized protein DS421_7g221040 [Arachis hypogaea]